MARDSIVSRERFTAYGPHLLIVFLAVVFFSPFFFQGRVFLAADTLYAHYPWKAYAEPRFMPHNPLITDPVNENYAFNYSRFLRKGVFMKWNPYILTGVPAAYSIGVPGPFYPPKILAYLLFPPAVASTLLLFMHVLLMGCGMYLYLLRIGGSTRGAVFGAVAYMFNGCAMVWLEFEIWVATAAYLPLILLCMEGFGDSEKRARHAAAIGGVAYGLMLLSGGLQLNYYASLFLAFYAVSLVLRNRRSAVSVLACCALTAVLGVLIGAAELLPLRELIVTSSRSQHVYSFGEFFDRFARVPFRYFVTLFFPDFFGNPIYYFSLPPALPTQTYMNYNELTLYTGVLAVFGLIPCLLRPRGAHILFFCGTAVAVLLMITGTPAYYPFFKLFPGMDRTNPTRLIFLFTFCGTVLAGLGIGSLESFPKGRRAATLAVTLLLTAGALVLALTAGRPDVSGWFNRELFVTDTSDARYLLGRLMEWRAPHSPFIIRPLVITLASAVLFAGYVLAPRRSAASRLIFVLMVVLLSYDLISFGRRYNTTVPPEEVYPVTPAITFLQQQPQPFRVVQDTGQGLYVNTLAPFGIEELGGYSSFYPERTNKIMSYMKTGQGAFSGLTFDRWVMFDNARGEFSSKFMDLMNVRYVLTSPYQLLRDQKYTLVYLNDLAVYENSRAMPRAYAVHACTVEKDPAAELHLMASDMFDMRKEVVLEESPPPGFVQSEPPSLQSVVTIDRYTADEVKVRADMAANGWLILSDTYFPGWEARVDGTKIRILRANFNFRAVPLAAGKHEVVFIYRPSSVRTGTTITLLAVLLTVVAGLLRAVMPGRRATSSSPAHR